MTLQRQLMLVSLLLLSLPWAGCQYIRELDATLAFAQEQTMTATAQAVSAVLAEEPGIIYPFYQRFYDNGNTAQQLFFKPADSAITIDGYDEDWQASGSAKTLTSEHDADFSVSYQSVIAEQQLLMTFSVTTNSIDYNNPTQQPLDNGDRIVLVTGNQRHYRLNSSAPGKINAYWLQGSGPKQRSIIEPQITAYWQDHGDRYSLEVKLPLALTNGRLGFYVVNQTTGQADDVVSHYQPMLNLETKTGNTHTQPPWLIYPPQNLHDKLAIFEQPGMRLKVVDIFAWQLASNGSLEQAQQPSGNWLLRKLYRQILGRQYDSYRAFSDSPRFNDRSEFIDSKLGRNQSQWYADTSYRNRSILATAVPVTIAGEVIATVVAEQTSDRFLALTSEAFSRLFVFSLAALGLTGLGILGYASWLSWRISALSRAAKMIISDDGQVLNAGLENLEQHFPSSRAGDEIGELNRNYQRLLKRLREYTLYLQTLSRKLSHELRTPLAIVHSSLDNLENCHLDEYSLRYQRRAKEGALRLGSIITAMSEASRVEESIESAEPEPVDLALLLSSISAAYQDLHQHLQLNYRSNIDANDNTMLNAVPELLVQMMDKLVDNAVDFTPDNGSIHIVFSQHDKQFVIAVSNDGPLLPDNMQSQLFDNMVSMRDHSATQSHLGLGLHIVRLIVEYHQGSIVANNRDDGLGVCFTIKLPQL